LWAYAGTSVPLPPSCAMARALMFTTTSRIAVHAGKCAGLDSRAQRDSASPDSREASPKQPLETLSDRSAHTSLVVAAAHTIIRQPNIGAGHAALSFLIPAFLRNTARSDLADRASARRPHVRPAQRRVHCRTAPRSHRPFVQGDARQCPQ